MQETVESSASEIAEQEKSWEERLAEQRAKDEEERVQAEKL